MSLQKSLFLLLTVITFSAGQTFAQDLDKGLIVHYPFNKDANDIVRDNPGEVNGARLEEGRCGDNAYYFDGSSSYIECGNPEIMNKNFGGMTLATWIRPEEYSAKILGTIMAKWGFDPQKDHFGMWINSSYRIIAAFSSAFKMENGTFSNTHLMPDTWYHVVATWNRNREVKIYIDGVLDNVGKQTGTGINTQSDASLKIGRQVIKRSRPFKGYIDDVRIYGRTLSDSEVKALYEMGKELCERMYINGSVLDKNTNDPVPSEVVFEDMETGKVIRRVPTQGEYAYYEAILPMDKKIAFYAEADNYLSENQNINTGEYEIEQTLTQDLYLVPFEVGESLRLNNIFFDFAKATLRSESHSELNRIIPYFKQYPNLKIELAGHTDAVGSDNANQKLSEDRANSVRNYLLSQGVPAAQIIAKGYGESKPVATNDTDEGRQKNRRVEFIILSK